MTRAKLSETDRTAARFTLLSAWIPFLFSGLAFLIVIANIVAGVQPQRDEGSSAHLWQLLMLGQVPFMMLFLATADWRRPKRPAFIALLQIAAFVTAALPVWLAGY